MTLEPSKPLSPLEGFGEDRLGGEEELIDPYNALITEQKLVIFVYLRMI
jgi:hypothetical protein